MTHWQYLVEVWKGKITTLNLTAWFLRILFIGDIQQNPPSYKKSEFIKILQKEKYSREILKFLKWIPNIWNVPCAKNFLMEKFSFLNAVIICAQSVYQNLFSTKLGLLTRWWKIENLVSKYFPNQMICSNSGIRNRDNF